MRYLGCAEPPPPATPRRKRSHAAHWAKCEICGTEAWVDTGDGLCWPCRNWLGDEPPTKKATQLTLKLG